MMPLVPPARVYQPSETPTYEDLLAALRRAHADLRWYADYTGKGSVALAENEALGIK